MLPAAYPRHFLSPLPMLFVALQSIGSSTKALKRGWSLVYIDDMREEKPTNCMGGVQDMGLGVLSIKAKHSVIDRW